MANTVKLEKLFPGAPEWDFYCQWNITDSLSLEPDGGTWCHVDVLGITCRIGHGYTEDGSPGYVADILTSENKDATFGSPQECLVWLREEFAAYAAQLMRISTT